MAARCTSRQNSGAAAIRCDKCLRLSSAMAFGFSSAHGPTREQWNEWIRGHGRIENGSQYVRDTEDASSRACAPSLIISYVPTAATTSKTPDGGPPSTSTLSSKSLDPQRTEQPWVRSSDRKSLANEMASRRFVHADAQPPQQTRRAQKLHRQSSGAHQGSTSAAAPTPSFAPREAASKDVYRAGVGTGSERRR